MNSLNKISHWVGQQNREGYKGPKEAAVLLKDNSLILVDMGNAPSWWKIVLNCRSEDVLGVLINTPRSGWYGEAFIETIKGPRTIYTVGCHGSDLLAAREELIGLVSTVSAEFEVLKKNPDKELEAILLNFDWNYQYSDDQGCFDAGEADFRRIIELKTKMDFLTYMSVWNQIAPNHQMF